MQLKKAVAAGAIGLLMAGSSIAFAASLGDYPAPFVTADGMQSLVVVGSGGTDPAGLASDVAGGIDIATRLAGAVTKDVSVGGTVAGVSVTGEGKGVATTNTKVYLNDSLGKSGLRTTMTKDDLSTLLKSGSITDSDGTHNFQQFIYLTPSTTTSTSYVLQFEKPASGSTADPTYRIGDFPTSLTPTEYMYKTSVVFDKEINRTAATNIVGEKMNIFGKEYTVLSDTTFVASSLSSNKLVLSGGAETKIIKSGETVSVALSGTSYDVTLTGTSSSTQAVIKVGNDAKTVDKQVVTKVGGLDVFVSDVFHLSTTDQTQNSAKILLGAEKLTLQHGGTVKRGSSDDSVQGTLVNLTVSSGKLASFSVMIGGASAENDFLGVGGTYQDPVWKSFSLAFPSVTPGVTDSTRNTLEITPSGNNYGKATIIDDKGQTATITFAYKSSDSGSLFSLADSSGYAIRVAENETISQNQYFVVDQGDFSHMYQVSGISLDSSTSSYIDLRDVFSGVTLKVSPSTDNNDEKVIDGQTYYFRNRSSTTFSITWGSGSPGLDALGTYLTVFPVLKGKNGEKYALTKVNQTVRIAGTSKIQLPTGAVTVATSTNGADTLLNLTATTMEDGTSSVCATTEGTSATTCVTNFNMSNPVPTQAFMLGRTATGGTWYNISQDTGLAGTVNGTVNVTIGYGSGGTTRQAATASINPAILLVEEKDNSNDIYAAAFSVATETSGSSQVVKAEVPAFTFASVNGDSLTSDSNKFRYVDLYGVYAERQTSGQDTVKVWYPDEQATANVFVLASGATTSESGASSATTVKQAVAVKTAVGRVDTEIGDTEKNTKNLILVGGPCVNTLVAELAATTPAKFDYTCASWPAQNIGVIKLVEDAFTIGKSALVVAGTTKTETRNAAKILMQYDDYATSLAAKKTVKVVDTTVSDLS